MLDMLPPSFFEACPEHTNMSFPKIQNKVACQVDSSSNQHAALPKKRDQNRNACKEIMRRWLLDGAWCRFGQAERWAQVGPTAFRPEKILDKVP